MTACTNQVIFSAGLLCLLCGCVTGKPASLEIRSVNHQQLAIAGEPSIERGKDLLRRGQNADAISAFRAALREEPDSAEAHNGLAIAYDGIGRKDLARRYFELAVAEKPGEVRYSANLANFFEGNGQSELAAGLRQAPVALASADHTVTPSMTLIIAETPIASEAVAAIDADPIAAIPAYLLTEPFNQPVMATVTKPEISSGIIQISNETAAQSLPAVFRPSIIPAIEAAQIPSTGLPMPHRDPLDRRLEIVADLPRNDRRQAVNSGPYIERVSLGEVNLVTAPQLAKNDVVFDFDLLGPKLAVWAADEARQVEFQKNQGLRGRIAIQNAVKRAAVDEALVANASLAAIAEQMQRDFAYISYDYVAAAEAPA